MQLVMPYRGGVRKGVRLACQYKVCFSQCLRLPIMLAAHPLICCVVRRLWYVYFH
jgi:hypothetical protein